MSNVANSWGLDRGYSVTISVGSTAFGMGIVGSDGFTTNVHQIWNVTKGGVTTWLCSVINDDPTTASEIFQTLN
jgi:hypothetical protein